MDYQTILEQFNQNGMLLTDGYAREYHNHFYNQKNQTLTISDIVGKNVLTKEEKENKNFFPIHQVTFKNKKTTFPATSSSLFNLSTFDL
jgi:hypothetical protein